MRGGDLKIKDGVRLFMINKGKVKKFPLSFQNIDIDIFSKFTENSQFSKTVKVN